MTPIGTAEAAGGKQGPLLVKGGDDQGRQAGDRVVGAVGAEGDPGEREGVTHSMRPLFHIAAASLPSPQQSLPLRRMLCSPGIDHSRRSQLSRKGSACGGARRRRAVRWGGGRVPVLPPQSKAANG